MLLLLFIAMFNVPQYYHYSIDNEIQVTADERKFIFAICISAAKITFEVN
jgi:hypothetical protein